MLQPAEQISQDGCILALNSTLKFFGNLLLRTNVEVKLQLV